MNAAQEYRGAMDRLSRTDRNLWLGQIVWYGVSDVQIGHTDLVKALNSNGLRAYIPRLPSDVDVFRRVCTKAQRKRVDRGDGDGWDNYLIRDIPMEGDEVHKVLVKETVQQGKLTYKTELCTITFSKKDSSLKHRCVGSDVVAQQIVSDVEANYNNERGTLNSYAVRELIRKILLSANAVNVRGQSGGVYFVSNDYQTTVEALENFAAAMPGDVSFHTHPLIDDSKQRDMVRAAYESETRDDVERLVEEMSTLEKKDSVSVARIEGYMKEFDRMKVKVESYRELLQTSSDSARSSIEILQRQILRLAAKVKP